MAITKIPADKTKPIVIQNFVTARPPRRTNFDVADWRVALEHAESEEVPNRTLLYDLYSDVLLDPHLSRQWAKRVEKVTNTKWGFSVNGEEDPVMAELIDTPEFETILEEIMGATAWGITLLEHGLITKVEFGEKVNNLTVYSVPRKHIKPETGIISKEQYDGKDTSNAIHYREGIFASTVAEIGKPKDLGCLLKVAPYVILKKGGVSDWAMFVQLFGQPFREYKYDGYNETTRIILEKSAQEMGSAPYIILPDGAQLTLHETKGTNTGEVHPILVRYCDEMISIHILGATETTTSSSSSGYAQAEVHAQTEDELYKADKRRVRRVLNRIIRPILYNLGYPTKGGIFHPVEEEDLKAVQERLKIIQTVKSLGEPVESDYIYETSGVPKPQNYDALKKDMEEKAEADSRALPPARKPGGPGGKKNLQDQSWWESFKLYVADFFDRAP